jgi:hypothetical protein
MITKMRPRYYCDFCKKSGGSKHHMQRHESSCTRNPDRECLMCRYALCKTSKEDVEKMVKIILDSIIEYDKGDFYTEVFCDGLSESIVMEQIREISPCPACILSALVLAKKPSMFPSFDYKEEKKKVFTSYKSDREFPYY